MRVLLAALVWIGIAGGALAQPVLTNHGSGTNASTLTAGSGDLVEVFTYTNGGSGTPAISTCGSINSGDWVARYSAVDGPNYITLFAAKAPSALSGCSLTVNRTSGTAALSVWGAWSGTSTAIFDSNFPTSALQTTGSSSTPVGHSLTTAQNHDIITTWVITPGNTAGCNVTTGGTGSWSLVDFTNSVSVGGMNGNQLSTTTAQSFTPADTGCGSRNFWTVLEDAITSDTVSTGRSRLIQ